MSEEAYKAIYDRAKARLEEMGKPELLDVLRPVQPGMARARAAFERFGLKLRLLAAAEADTAFNFLGRRLPSPLMVSAMGEPTLRTYHPEPFRVIATGALRAGAQYWIGDCEDSVWEEAAKLAPSSVRVVKPWREEGKILTSLKLAEEAGALAAGVDFETGIRGADCAPKSARQLASYVKAIRIPFVVKGVGSLESARVARDAGAKAIVVTVHGGSLGATWGHPLEVLPEIARGVGSDLLVLAESGVRRGEDALKLLARGAKGVLVGRAVLLGFFAAGADGVAEVLRNLNEELKEHMLFAGCPDLASINEEVLIPR